MIRCWSVIPSYSLFILLLCTGCNKPSPSLTQKSANEPDSLVDAPSPIDSTSLSLDSLQNALINGDCGWIRLKNGEAKCFDATSFGDTVETNIGLTGDFISADIIGDGYKDAIGTIATTSGGSGIFLSLVIFLNDHGIARHVGSFSIGDREPIDSLFTSGDTIHVFYTAHGPDDPMCCPTLEVQKSLKLVDTTIVELN